MDKRYRTLNEKMNVLLTDKIEEIEKLTNDVKFIRRRIIGLEIFLGYGDKHKKNIAYTGKSQQNAKKRLSTLENRKKKIKKNISKDKKDVERLQKILEIF